MKQQAFEAHHEARWNEFADWLKRAADKRAKRDPAKPELEAMDVGAMRVPVQEKRYVGATHCGAHGVLVHVHDRAHRLRDVLLAPGACLVCQYLPLLRAQPLRLQPLVVAQRVLVALLGGNVDAQLTHGLPKPVQVR